MPPLRIAMMLALAPVNAVADCNWTSALILTCGAVKVLFPDRMTFPFPPVMLPPKPNADDSDPEIFPLMVRVEPASESNV